MSPDDATLVQRYLDHVRFDKRLAARTHALYTEDLKKLQQHAQDAGTTLLTVGPHHIRRWVAQMHSSGRSPRGMALILSGWRGFYNWLGKESLVSSNPVQGVRAPKAAKPLPKALSVDEAVQLADFKQEGASASVEARDRALVELLYSSGLRVGELVGLDVQASSQAAGWVDMQAAEAHVLGKGSKRRTVPVGQAAMAALRAWLDLRPTMLKTAETALFINERGTRLTARAIWGRLRTRSQQAGLSAPVHPHMLRHSFASHVLQSSGDLRAVQELLGHANISTTQVYTRLDFQHLAKVYDAAHPRAHKPKP